MTTRPLFQGDLPYNATVREDVEVGFSILRVTATDLDDGVNGTVKYAITGGDRPGKNLISTLTSNIYCIAIQLLTSVPHYGSSRARTSEV